MQLAMMPSWLDWGNHELLGWDSHEPRYRQHWCMLAPPPPPGRPTDASSAGSAATQDGWQDRWKSVFAPAPRANSQSLLHSCKMHTLKHFTGHFPSESGLAGLASSLLLFIYLFLKRISAEKWHRFFYRPELPDALPFIQPTASKHRAKLQTLRTCLSINWLWKKENNGRSMGCPRHALGQLQNM